MNGDQAAASPAKRHRGRLILAVVAVVVIVGALASIMTIALQRNATLKSQLTAANARAANAQAVARQDYAARNAALNQKSQIVAAEIGELKANTIRADGLYVIGHDIQAGVWHTAGDGQVSGTHCGFAIVKSAAGANSPPGALYFDGPWTLHLSGAGVYAVAISGPCTWTREP